ncbi:MAG TPA: isocitrate/isopropylmalate dehydrogenase family protein [Phycisphaerae bacterium]|nr:isocitrate/isopropylmalate dehydrogenase family protein [Phycisphaerae bacterium]HOJ74838.1 isocitrate/isopropylmalate dehydrogenase family protein [Phycisphaerae bacterium]HOM52001.1 isocitrate/isopropylmalate dehydrogenase family protein [Phycisphaerae bacterium]HOQ86465.1 isocitrate/isopropylmalate dehydrogenase family protein [Phycisphaerae bacterium]HPP27375.1 isocitrate/isopropylmalate dehydrogenase family protein [Phycisphaerae bacterium]
MMHTVCLLPGDGIGPEVTSAARRVIDESGANIEWVPLPLGATGVELGGSPLPQRTLAAVAGHGVALKGPVTTPIGKGYESVNVRLRKKLNLFAAVRPVRNLPGIESRFSDVELVIIRENTEGLYSGLENEVVPGVVQSLKIVSEAASLRIAHFAFEYAVNRGRKKVTCFHKANIMKKSDGLFLECARRVAQKYADRVQYDEMIIDNGCMQLVRDPSQFDVLLLENLYGDIVSDLAAGLVGGLGVVPGANIGEKCAVFEPVHGSAPTIARKGLANPLACIMSGVMMLNHLGETVAAQRIRDAYNKVLAERDLSVLTPDIGGTGTTQSFTDAIIAAMKKP